MQKNKIFSGKFWSQTLLSLALVTSATSCSNEADEVKNDGQARLAINVALNQPASRAIITGNAMPSGSQIGIQLTGDGYDAYNNIKFTESGSTWAPVSDVLLTKNKGTLYAYYPYAESTDLAAINVETTSQTDYLYATPVANINENNAEADLTMNHALANIKLQFINNNYGAGAGNVSNITVTGDGFATSATFNAAQTTPDYVANSFAPTTGASITTDATVTLGHENAIDLLVIPNGQSKKLTITAEIDGQQYTATTAADITLQKGKSYLYKLSLSSTYMAVDNSVTVTDWNKGNGESGEGLNLDKEDPLANATNGVYIMTAAGTLAAPTTQDNTALGVVLITDNQRILISKADATDGTNTTLYWGKNLYGKDVAGITETTETSVAKTDFNGKANTEAIIAAYGQHSVDMDSRDMCKVLSTYAEGGFTDWYVPAAGQLYEMYTKMSDINTALQNIGGTALESNSYWSSSESDAGGAWRVVFNNGGVDYIGKNYGGGRVRFVRDI